jgi:FAD/FMN-containing dehydrogenase
VRPHLGSEAAQNYADPGLSSARRAYYGANLERLVTIKRRVDPLNVFRHAQSIPVKL